MNAVLRLLICALVIPTTPAHQVQPCQTPSPATDAKYVTGQVWAYHTRPGEDAGTITILKIETLPKIGEIIHVRMDGIRLHNCSGGPEPDQIQHAPFTRDAIERSVTRLLKTRDVPDFQAGYSDWLAHCGGVYTITVAVAVDADEKTFNSSQSCTAQLS